MYYVPVQYVMRMAVYPCKGVIVSFTRQILIIFGTTQMSVTYMNIIIRLCKNDAKLNKLIEIFV